MAGSDWLDQLDLREEAKERALRAVEETGESLPVTLSRLGLVPDVQVLGALSEATGFAIAERDALPEAPVETPIAADYLRAVRALPLAGDSENGLVIGLVNPVDDTVRRAVRFAAGGPVEFQVLGFEAWRASFDRLYAESGEASHNGQARAGARWANDLSEIKDLKLDAPAVRQAESLITEAVERRASDIHIERKPDSGLIRFRVDGALRDHIRVPPGLADALIARLKVLADMDVADHRRAQDGRLVFSARGRPVDVRLSIIPSAFGEGAAIRLLDRDDIRHNFSDLGFSPDEEGRLTRAIRRPKGLFLVSGPTGSGKSTTLYAAVNALRSTDRKIMTVEDPIEYFFEDVHQTQLDTAAGLSFAAALRSFLRHDPDIILVGEIRDPETAKTAVQAALTGHLVLSTIHANDAASVPARLVEMGVEPFLLAGTLTATTAQRLVRRLCDQCSVPDEPPVALLQRAGLPVSSEHGFCKPVGCAACHGGYKGRMVVSETLVADEAVLAAIRDGCDAAVLRRNIETVMLRDGLAKAAQGQTSADEVLRALEAM
jgi:general secretion pathway protein E